MVFSVRKKRKLLLTLASAFNLLAFLTNAYLITTGFYSSFKSSTTQSINLSTKSPTLKVYLQNTTNMKKKDVLTTKKFKALKRRPNKTVTHEKYPTFHPDSYGVLFEPWNTCAYKQGENVLLLAYVMSKSDNFERRQLIRSTWAHRKHFASVQVFFVLGTSRYDRLNKQIEHEAKQHGDVLQGDFIDSYRNLSFKSLCAWEWIAENCVNARNYLKLDDDVIVNTYAMLTFLNENARILEHLEWTFLCIVYRRSQVIRDPRSKYYMPWDQYPKDKYFTYCSGNAVFMTGDLFDSLLEAANSTRAKSLWIDDLYVGMLANQIEYVQFIDLGDMFYTSVEYEDYYGSSKRTTRDRPLDLGKYLFVRLAEDRKFFEKCWLDIKRTHESNKTTIDGPTTTRKFQMDAFGHD
jgi:hypothetical protein